MLRPHSLLASAAALLLACLSAGPVSAASPAVERWRPLAERASARYGVPTETILAIIAVESGGNPLAVGAASERGLMQILPSTGRLLGAGNLHDPAVNIDAGARYLAAELRACDGNVRCAVNGWNAGPRGRYAPPASTRAFTATVLVMAEQMRAERAPAPVVASETARAFGLGSRLAATPREW